MSFANVEWVSGEEKNRRKGHNFLTVFSDQLAKRLLFVRLAKDASVWGAFVAELLQHNGHLKAIRRVAIDMSAANTKWVASHLGNARVVSDKFHVIQNVVGACDQVQKEECRSDAGKRELLERTR